MGAPEMVRVAAVAVVGAVILRKQPGADDNRLGLGGSVDRVRVPYAEGGIKGTPGPPTPEKIGRRRPLADQHGVAGSVCNICETRSRAFVHYAVAFWPRQNRIRASDNR